MSKIKKLKPIGRIIYDSGDGELLFQLEVGYERLRLFLMNDGKQFKGTVDDSGAVILENGKSTYYRWTDIVDWDFVFYSDKVLLTMTEV